MYFAFYCFVKDFFKLHLFYSTGLNLDWFPIGEVGREPGRSIQWNLTVNSEEEGINRSVAPGYQAGTSRFHSQSARRNQSDPTPAGPTHPVRPGQSDPAPRHSPPAEDSVSTSTGPRPAWSPPPFLRGGKGEQ